MQDQDLKKMVLIPKSVLKITSLTKLNYWTVRLFTSTNYFFSLVSGDQMAKYLRHTHTHTKRYVITSVIERAMLVAHW